MKFVFLGPPGAGKGTQAQAVSKALGIPHISTGGMFRDAIAAGTPAGLKSKAFIDEGKLVPDEIVTAMVRERLSAPDVKDGYLLDGFPRTVTQAEALEEIDAPDAVIDIEVGDEELVERLTGRRQCRRCGGTHHIRTLIGDVCPACQGELYQRNDDKSETIRKRLEVYQNQTAPLIDYYLSKGLLLTIDGSLDPDGVAAQIEKALRSVL